jgi:hypothetical protein
MPVNMDPGKRLRPYRVDQPASTQAASGQAPPVPKELGEETPEDRERALAEAEWKNLWEATEVIDMDTW